MGNVLTRAELFIQQSHPWESFSFQSTFVFLFVYLLAYYLPSHNVNKCRVLDLTFPLDIWKKSFTARQLRALGQGATSSDYSHTTNDPLYIHFFHRVKSSNSFWLLKVNIIFQFLNKCAGGGMGGGVFNALRLLISAPIHFATPF